VSFLLPAGRLVGGIPRAEVHLDPKQRQQVVYNAQYDYGDPSQGAIAELDITFTVVAHKSVDASDEQISALESALREEREAAGTTA
jgi:hypothetical protein